jgi:hypothetical protein
MGTPQLGPEQVKAGGFASTPQLASASAATNATLHRMLLSAFLPGVYKFKFYAASHSNFPLQTAVAINAFRKNKKMRA